MVIPRVCSVCFYPSSYLSYFSIVVLHQLPKVEVKTWPKIKLPLQRLTPAQMEEGRKKGLCCNYDEKWTSDHYCKGGANCSFLKGCQWNKD